MTVNWTSESVGLHMAECRLGAGVVVHLLVERLGDFGWDWQVWDPAQCVRADCGVANTLETAKVRAELAVIEAVACVETELAGLLERLRGSL